MRRDECSFDRFFLVDGRLKVGGRDPARYVAVSRDSYDRFFAEAKYADIQHFYQLLDEQYPMVATFRPAPDPVPTVFTPAAIVRSVGTRPKLASGSTAGPTIKVYAIPAANRLPATSDTEARTPIVSCP